MSRCRNGAAPTMTLPALRLRLALDGIARYSGRVGNLHAFTAQRSNYIYPPALVLAATCGEPISINSSREKCASTPSSELAESTNSCRTPDARRLPRPSRRTHISQSAHWYSHSGICSTTQAMPISTNYHHCEKKASSSRLCQACRAHARPAPPTPPSRSRTPRAPS